MRFSIARNYFHDFYTIKPFWVSDFGAKILTCYCTLIFKEARRHLISDAHSERAHQFLMRTLSAHISS